jgi:hypothetical protein
MRPGPIEHPGCSERSGTDVGRPRRGTITPAIGKQEEAKDVGFLEEALARPGG